MRLRLERALQHAKREGLLELIALAVEGNSYGIDNGRAWVFVERPQPRIIGK